MKVLKGTTVSLFIAIISSKIGFTLAKTPSIKDSMHMLFIVVAFFILAGFFGILNLLIASTYATLDIATIIIVLFPTTLLLIYLIFLFRRFRSRATRVVLPLLGLTTLTTFFYTVGVLGINEYQSVYTREKWVNNPAERVRIVDNMQNMKRMR